MWRQCLRPVYAVVEGIHFLMQGALLVFQLSYAEKIATYVVLNFFENVFSKDTNRSVLQDWKPV